MYLFFDGVSSQGYIGLFDSQKKCIASDTFAIAGNESTRTIPLIGTFLEKYNIGYEDIENIVTIVGPGSFTGIRTISLVVNTLAYIYPNISLTPYSFFDLYHEYPIVKASSKRDLFVKWEKHAIIEIVQNGDFESQHEEKIVYGDVNLERFQKFFSLNSEINYTSIFQNIECMNKKQIAPLYIKKPNIS